jgi:hypothetical protein
MPLILPGNVASATASTTYDVANSCRFNDGDSAKMAKTPDENGSDVKFTFSCWVKRGSNLGSQSYMMLQGTGATFTSAKFDGSDRLDLQANNNGAVAYNLTNRKFRDPSAWYHIVWAIDTTQSVAGNRVKVYINGTEETSWSSETVPDEDDTLAINNTSYPWVLGAETSSNYFDGYMAEVVYIDGTQYAASDFGEFDEDSPTIWKPKAVSGLTFGTNGFYLDFEASGNLGNDANGGTDLTETNLAAADQATDSPTNNFCVMNPLDNYFAAGTFSEGNCKVVSNASNTTWGTSTFGLTAGKWYFEVKFEGTLGGGEVMGIVDRVSDATSQKAYNASGGKNAVWRSGGDLYVDDSNDTDFTPGGGDLWASNDILGVFIDLDNNKIYCAVNGSIIISGAGADITAVSSTLNNAYFIIAGDSNTASTDFEFNFGGCSAFALSSAVNDSNGYGNFEYSPNQGGASNFDSTAKNFLAICTKNLGSDGG